MAPTAKARPFEECSIVLSGTFPGQTRGSLSKDIKDLGGAFTSKITEDTTHVVVSEKDWEGRATRVKRAAEFPDISIVSLDWLQSTIESKSKADETLYLMANPSSVPASKADNKGKKRSHDGNIKAESSEDEQQPPTKKHRNDQQAKSQRIHVPVDDGCTHQGTHAVYVEKDGIIFDASLNQTNAGNNANKFYRIQLLKSLSSADYRTWTRWGRVGERGQSALLGDGSLTDAMSQFEKKFKDKSGHKWADRLEPPRKGKYTFIERNYEEDTDNNDDLPGAGSRRSSKQSASSESRRQAAESALAKSVQELMQLIFNQQYFTAAMDSMSYDSNKLPLGKLSKRTLKSGFEALKQLAELLANPNLADEVHNMQYPDAVQEISNSYYTFIPHSFGRNRPPIICNDDMLRKEVDLLESLSDMSIAEEIMKEAKEDVESLVHPLDRQYAGLGMAEMEPLEHKSTEFKELQDYLLKTHGATHGMKFKVEQIFCIERNGEFARFSKSPYAGQKGDRRLLWHGSRCTNFGGILSQGLRIAPPEAPVNGYMFGKGVYLADISSKSAGYCQYQMSGGIGLLLLCEAELGKPMLELIDADMYAPEEAKKKGCYATWGKGRTGPMGWKDAGCVHPSLKGVSMPDTTRPPGSTGVGSAGLYYNEYICYDVAQIRLRYLFRVKIT